MTERTAASDAAATAHQSRRSRKRAGVRLREILGPGLITGASDDDPSGIATYSQAGAAFGYGLGWTMLFTYPLISVVQMVCARVGRTTGHGIAGNLRRHYPAWLTTSLVSLLVLANTINIGADLGAMGDATGLVSGGPPWLFLLLFAAFCAFSEVFMRYANYVRVLTWLTLALLAYVATLFIVDVPWRTALYAILVPQVTLSSRALMMVVAVLGTTISPYLFFWQASEEAEDVRDRPDRHPLKCAPEEGREELVRIGLDTFAGMAASNFVGLAIILTAGATLHVHGITNIESSQQAAEALRPIAGQYASTLFALGIVGTGLLAVPILAGSAAYALGEALRWPVGLDCKPRRAKAFYGTIIAATAVGAAMNFTPINPIKALYLAAVINGIVSVPVMAVMMLMASRKAIMGVFTISPAMRWVGWAATGVMAMAVVAMAWSTVTSIRPPL